MFKNFDKYFLICGMIAPLYMTFNLIVLGFYHPNYNHLTQYISELGAINAPYSNIMNVGFVIFGLMIILFSYGLYKILYDKYSKTILIASLLIVISGLSFFLIGFFPCDPNCINFSTIGIIHGYLSDSAQFPLIIAPLFLLNKLRENKKFNNIFIYSIITIFLGVIFCIIYKIDIFDDYTGLFQRISFGIPILWVEIMAIITYRSNTYNL